MKRTALLAVLALSASVLTAQNVGVGFAAPTSKVYIRSDGNTSASSALNITNSSTTSLLFVRDDGHVGIGTATPSATARLHVDLGTSSVDGVLMSGTYSAGPVPNLGAGTRFMWYPGKSAFRVGHVTGTQWNDANVGIYSFATGWNTEASGLRSSAMGGATTASGSHSTAMGEGTTASGSYSTAMGRSTSAGGQYSVAMGQTTTASGAWSTAMGLQSTASGDLSRALGWNTTASGDHTTAIGTYVSTNTRLGSFVIGDWSGATTMNASTTNQFSARFDGGYRFFSDAATTTANGMFFTGGQLGLATAAPSATLDVEGSFQYVDGNESLNYLMRSDASGNATWVAPGPLGLGLWNETFQVNAGNLELTDGLSTLSVPLTSLGDADWTVSGNDIYNANSGFVGISTSSPTFPLHMVRSYTTATGVDFDLTSTSATGGRFGIRADLTASTSSTAVAGQFTLSSATSAGTTWALFGSNTSDGNINVGVAGSTNSTGTWNFGVDGNATGASALNYGGRFTASGSAVTNYGVRAYASGATNNWAGYFGNGAAGDGNVRVEDLLHADGSLQFTDGSEALDRVLRSDASGNATWVDPNTLISNDADWTVSGSDMYSAVSGDVGIGTSTPQYKLDVNSSITRQYSNASTVHVQEAYSNSLGISSILDLRKGRGTEASPLPVTLSHILGSVNFTGEDGTGFNTGARIQAWSTENWGAFSNGTALHFRTTANGSSGSNTRMTIDHDGEVGIGTATPGALLDVDGDVIVNESGGDNDVRIEGDTDPNLFFTDASVDAVGIGTSSPTELLSVNGGVRIGNSTNTNAGTVRWTGTDFEGYDGSAWQSLTATGDADWTVSGGNVYNTTDDVGIGTNNPLAKLHLQADNSSRIYVDVYGSAGGSVPELFLRRARGSVATPLSVQNGDNLGQIRFGGHDGSLLWGFASISAYATQNWTTTAEGTALWFTTVANGSNVGSTRMVIDENGNVGIGTTSPSATAKLHVELATSTTDGIVARGTYNAASTVPDIGAGSRMMWYPGKSAFRAGNVTSTQWNNANVGLSSFASGVNTTASGTSSSAIGEGTTASGSYSTAMGRNTTASTSSSTAMGEGSTASGSYSTAMGFGTTASGNTSTAIGRNTSATAQSSTAMGDGTTASGNYSTAMGRNTTATVQSATAMGEGTTASGNYSTAMGNSTTASGSQSTAMGGNTTASGNTSTAMGFGTTASNNQSTAMGFNTTASGLAATSMGFTSSASGQSSTALGEGTTASGEYTTAMGANTHAESGYETVVGRYNTDYTPNSTVGWNNTDRLFVAGNGTGPGSRSDALVILKNGNTGIGTSTPSATLDVEGTFQYDHASATTNDVLISTDNQGNAVWADVNTLVADDGDWTVSGNNIYNANTGTVGIGTSTPVYDFDLNVNEVRQYDNVGVHHYLEAYSTLGGGFPRLHLRRARGTSAAPAAITNGNALGALFFAGHDGSAMGNGSMIYGYAAENWTPSAHGSRIVFRTTPTGSTVSQVRMTIANSGDVGIGNSSPTALLDVDGDVIINESGGNSDVRIEGDTEQNLMFTDASADRVGVGTATPAARFSVEGGGFSFNASNGNYNVLMEGQTDANLFSLDASADAIGIGTNAPGAKLDVRGSVIINEAGGNNDTRIEGDTEANLFVVDASADQIGIGTATPSAQLDIQGTSGRALEWDNGRGALQHSTDAIYWERDFFYMLLDADGGQNNSKFAIFRDLAASTGINNSDLNFSFESGNSWFVPAANFGIGTKTPGGQFELSLDQGRKPSTNTWTIVSDERLKTVHGEYQGGLDEVLALEPIVYNYKNSEARQFEDEVLETENVGFSAQQVQEIFPEAVGADEDGYLNFNMHAILVAYVNAFKEQQEQIESLKQSNESLQTELEVIKQNLGMEVER